MRDWNGSMCSDGRSDVYQKMKYSRTFAIFKLEFEFKAMSSQSASTQPRACRQTSEIFNTGEYHFPNEFTFL